MSAFWSGWIISLIVFNLGVSLFLFVWGTRVKIPTIADGTTGHVWAHGTILEGVHRLPLWWVLFSASMFIAAFTYLALYPGFGSYKGVLGWTSHGELASDTATNQAKLDHALERLKGQTIEQLAADGSATSMGQRLFIDNCAACHGREGHGNRVLGAPNLTDSDWLYGGDSSAITASILDGRHGVMPPFASSFDAESLTNLANYVLSLSGADHSPFKAAAGKPLCAVCSACHGVEGKGNPLLGAPNLTDTVWLYGGDLASIKQTIRNGRGGVMPPWRTRLDDTDTRLVAAWVYAQSHGEH